LFTGAETAQSIPVPLSYFVDGGYVEIIVLGLIQGYLARYFWIRADCGGVVSKFIYVMYILFLLWTIRSGTIAFSPLALFEFGAFMYILQDRVAWLSSSRFILLLRFGFLFSVPVTLAALAIRL
jgi:hypothetical protein